MNISYEPLWNLLKSKNMKKKDLLEKANLTTNCIVNMGKNEYISFRNIEYDKNSANTLKANRLK